MNGTRPDGTRLRLDATSYGILRQQVLRRDGWRCQSCGTMSSWKSTTSTFAAIQAMTLSWTWSPCAHDVMLRRT